MCCSTIFWGVSLRHIRETWTEVIQVFTNQWVLTSHVNVVSDSHQGTWAKSNTSSCIGYNDTFTSEYFHYTYWESHDFKRIAFVEMEASLKSQDLAPCKFTIYQFPSVSDDCRTAPVWNLSIVYYNWIFDFFCQFSQT